LRDGYRPSSLRIRWLRPAGATGEYREAPRLRQSGSEELCRISRGYLLEVPRLNGITAEAEKLSCAGLGDAVCAWDLHSEQSH